MTTVLETAPGTTWNVGMGKALLGRPSERFVAVLGSCIGVVLHAPRLKLSAMAHVVLAKAAGDHATPGKYADTAIPRLMELLLAEGATAGGIVARMAGGAAMFGGSDTAQIGLRNAEAVRETLAAVRIPLLAEDIGGKKGRRVTCDCQTGQLCVEIVGQPTKTL